jgi:hypothetical protein
VIDNRSRFVTQKILAERHGRITDLKICKEQFVEKNAMDEDMKTLEDYNIRGASENAPPLVRLAC